MINQFELFIVGEEIKVLLLSPSMMVFNCFFRLHEAEKCISEESLSTKRASGFVARCKPFVLEEFRKQILKIV